MADLTLLTAQAAAKILDVDPKTFRKMPVPFIIAGNSRRYTRAILEGWLERSVQQCQQIDQNAGPRRGKSRVSNTLSSGRGRPSGRSASGSAVIDFEQVAGLSGSRTQRP
jgi:hypothetical protein